MTLSINKWIEAQLKQKSAIHHIENEFRVKKPEDLPSRIKSRIADEYGDSYLLDSQFCIFFKDESGFDQKKIKNIFAMTNDALGKAANNMSESDFKILKSESNAAQDDSTTDDASEMQNFSSNYLFLKITLKK